MKWNVIEERANAANLNYDTRVLLIALIADPSGYLMNDHVEFVIQGRQFDFFNAVESLVRAEIIAVRPDSNGIGYYWFLGDRQEQSEQG